MLICCNIGVTLHFFKTPEKFFDKFIRVLSQGFKLSLVSAGPLTELHLNVSECQFLPKLKPTSANFLLAPNVLLEDL